MAGHIVRHDPERAKRLVSETETLLGQALLPGAADEIRTQLAFVYAALGKHSSALTAALSIMDLYDRAQAMLGLLRAVPMEDRRNLSSAAQSLAAAQIVGGVDSAALFTMAGLALWPDPANCARFVGEAVKWHGTSDEVLPQSMTALLLAKVDPRFARTLARRAALTARRGWMAAADEVAAIQALVRCGEFEEAEQLICCGQPTVLDRVQRALNRELAARNRTSRLGTPWASGWVEGLIECGQAKHALDVVSGADQSFNMATILLADDQVALCAIALTASEPEIAESVARDLERSSVERADLPEREYAVAAVAQMLTDAKDEVRAEQLARTLPDRDAKVAVLLHIARAHAAESPDRAVKLADEVRQLLNVTAKRDRRGRVDRYAAEYWFRTIGMIEVLAKSGRVDQARDLCDAFIDRLPQADALAVLAASLGEGTKEAEAREEAKGKINELIEILSREEELDPTHPFRHVDPDLFSLIDADVLFCYISERIANRGVISLEQRNRLAEVAVSLTEHGLVDAEIGAAALVTLQRCQHDDWEQLLRLVKHWEGECAEIVCAVAATGDFKEAMRLARLPLDMTTDPAAPTGSLAGDMLEALALVAELAAGVDASKSELLGAAPGQEELRSGRRILACVPRERGQQHVVAPDAEIARYIVRYLLSTSKWYLALRALSALAPDGVPLLGHLALGQAALDAATPQVPGRHSP
ncbi:hypothetical protein [Streptomyces sp. 900105245]